MMVFAFIQQKGWRLMHYTNYGPRSKATPQNEPIPGSSQVPNNAQGYSWAVDDLTRLTRFLILGSENGTYYVGERELTRQNLATLDRLLLAGRGREVVDLIVEISQAGRAAKNDPALFALARCCACDVHGLVTTEIPARTRRYAIPEGRPMRTVQLAGGAKRELADGETTSRAGGLTLTRQGQWITEARPASKVQGPHPEDLAVRQYALSRLREVARTGTHFLHFLSMAKQFRGWGRAYRAAAAAWYTERPERHLAYQLLKYQSRDGYSQRDGLRLAHPRPDNSDQQHLYHWVTKGWPGVGEEPHPDEALRQIWAFERAKRVKSAEEVVPLIQQYRLPREAVPTEYLTSPAVWEALLEEMPLEALLRNLATMTRVGLLKPFSAPTLDVIHRLGDSEALKRARLHPVKILAALLTYQSGHGVRSTQSWTPQREIVDALNNAFYASFAHVASSGKRVLLAIDVSSSMRGTGVNGVAGLDCHTAAAAMAMVTARAEWKEVNGIQVPQYQAMAFDTHAHALTISPSQRLDDIVSHVNRIGGGGTDCAAPFHWLLCQHLDVDAIITLSDSETWYGKSHPSQVLDRYRQQVGHPVRAINVQMAATQVSNNDPADRDALECVGFDTTTPQLISAFLRGEF